MNQTISMPVLQGYKMQLLTPAHLPQMLGLQEEVLEWLGPEKQNYLVPNTSESFTKYFFGPNKAIGVFRDERLVAQAMVAFIMPGIENKKLTNCSAAKKIIDKHSAFAVIGGILVKPSDHGKKLMQMMLEETKTHYHAWPIIGEVAIGNDPSENSFLKAGFENIGEGMDYSDYCCLCFMQYYPKQLPPAVKP